MKINPLPTKQRLRFLFDYKRGVLIRKTSGYGALKGQKLGWLTPHGYYRAYVDGEEYAVHRLIWVWHFGSLKTFIDHKNGNKKDNRIENLRLATKAQNEWHKPKRRHNTTGFKNVYKLSKNCKGRKRYWAYFTINGKRHGLGMYSTAKHAHLAYKNAAKKHHGEFHWNK